MKQKVKIPRLFRIPHKRKRSLGRMNYILQIKGFWVAHNEHSFSADEIALYFYLLEVCNTLAWKNPFKRNNFKIMADLGIKDRRTLDRHRNSLKQSSIIDFKTKNGDANATYTLSDLSIFCTGFGTGNGIGDGIGTRSGNGIGDGIDKINQTGNQTKPINSEPNGSVAGASDSLNSSKEKKEKKLAPKKEKEITPFWDELKKVWFDYYRGVFEVEPRFEVLEATNFAKILKRLQKLSEQKGFEWNGYYAEKVLLHFLTKAHSDRWIKENFLIPTLYSKFDAIINRKDEGFNEKQSGLANLKEDIARDLERLASESI